MEKPQELPVPDKQYASMHDLVYVNKAVGGSAPVAPMFPALVPVGRPNLGSRRVFNSYMDVVFASRHLTNDGPMYLARLSFSRSLLIFKCLDSLQPRVSLSHAAVLEPRWSFHSGMPSHHNHHYSRIIHRSSCHTTLTMSRSCPTLLAVFTHTHTHTHAPPHASTQGA